MSTGTILLARARAIADYECPVAGTDALAAAAANFEANRIALEAVHAEAATSLPDALPEMEWLYARDGALTARHVDRQWFGDCSVPRRAAERFYATLDVAGGTAVMLAPTHAQQLRVALARLSPRQALIAILPGDYDAGVILACDDFAAELRAGRLWPVVGPDWRRQLDELLADHVGLAPAATMIRVPGVNDAIVDRLLRPCEAILNKHAQSHRQQLALIESRPVACTPRVGRAAVVVGAWRPWADDARLLRDAMRESAVECVAIDTARPDRASALSIARRAERCDAIVVADLGRADAPSLAPAGVAWVTLAAAGRVPAVGGPRDRLVCVDAGHRVRAVAAGWPADRVDVLAAAPATPSAGGRPLLAFDLPAIEKPAEIAAMSSHGLVFDRCVRELLAGVVPSLAPDRYLAQLGAIVGIAPGELPLELLRDRALVPAIARATVVRLTRLGVAFDLYGSGWATVPEAAGAWRGPIADEASFEAAIAGAGVIVDVWAGVASHASRRCGRSTLAAWGKGDARLAAELRVAASAPAPSRPRLDLDAVLAAI